MEHLVYLMRHLFILTEVRRHDNQFTTQPLRNLNRLCRMHPIATCLVACCRYHATLTIIPHGNWLAAQFRIVTLLHGSEKLIHIHMDDFPLVHILCKDTEKKLNYASRKINNN